MAAERYKMKALPLKHRPCEEGQSVEGKGTSQGAGTVPWCVREPSGYPGKAKEAAAKGERVTAAPVQDAICPERPQTAHCLFSHHPSSAGSWFPAPVNLHTVILVEQGQAAGEAVQSHLPQPSLSYPHLACVLDRDLLLTSASQGRHS